MFTGHKSLAGGPAKILVRGGTLGRFVPVSKNSGYLIYVNRATLFAVPFDLDKLEARGTPTPVLDNVSYSPNLGSAQFDVSRDGVLVYRDNSTGSSLVTVQFMDASGKTQLRRSG